MGSIFMRFPGGKAKALTLSYDDGVEQDIRLVEIMQKNGLKGTFNINSGLYAPEGKVYPEGTIHRRMSKSMAVNLFKDSGMEVAVHGLTHPYLEQLPAGLCAQEVLQDRINLEAEFDTIIRGMAYPYGTTSDSVVETLKQCGIAYSRTTESTEKFAIPTDWLRLPATCHHRNPRLMELAKEFAEKEHMIKPELFYLWGHSYEFEANDNWHVIEEFAEYMGNREDIWYATNIEIYDYIAAYNQLIFGMGTSIGTGTNPAAGVPGTCGSGNAGSVKVYNPTCTTLYFNIIGTDYCIQPGETMRLK